MSHRQSVEQQLIAAGEGKGINESFIARTMKKVKAAKADALFNATFVPSGKPSLFRRFAHMPKFAIAAMAFGTCVFVSGTAYAAYILWISPSAQVRSVENKYGRDQALIDLKNCSGSNPKVTIEITKDSSGTAQGAADSVLAHCELQAVQAWAMQNLHAQPGNVLSALTVAGTNGTSISTQFSGEAAGASTTYNVPSDTPVIFQGKAIRLKDLQKGDAVVIVTKDNHTAQAVIKLSLAAKYYASDEVNNDYHDRQACVGNAPASCISLPNLDVLRTGEGGANPDYHAAEGYEIQGKLISYTSSFFILEATDGTRYTVHTDSDIIGAFNAGNPYDAQSPVAIEPSDVLMVRYEQPKGDNPKDIQFTEYHAVQLMLQGFSKKSAGAQNMQKYHY